MSDMGDACWQCLHCSNCKLSGVNATKTFHHVLKIQGQNVCLCRAKIPLEYAIFYENLYFITQESKKERQEYGHNRRSLLEEHQQKMTSQLKLRAKRNRSNTALSPINACNMDYTSPSRNLNVPRLSQLNQLSKQP